ncbi:putative transcription factor & chromatin remodeling ARID family [Helianthus annuus]|nr:putative transcription factor & chromatin remodeling ARID family [Helianthus annuus]KAJ0442817.1 putative transcription factor & chromatin remodeling ARID family [Helianthus annuus]KAJ0640914.1 putative transcription factor & chromatin remodeling ARID family [Helianthus annuus]KAJ0644832.1 putative transcription factor & chromatin remodeling ARID family [Helianthus annuus]KAJ0821232.1 putative transcription factor & chromatin remodeling ARID family [Helianthus annuus]
MMKSEPDYEAFKTEYLNQDFESLNISSNEHDRNVLILQAMSFKEFQDCKALLDMLEDEDYVSKYKFCIERKFEDMVDWFLKEKLEITTRPLPAYAADNRKVSLLELYMIVKREGGHRRVTENNMWVMVAKDMGFNYNEGEFMRLMYAMYLDVLVYYYKFKSTQ